MEDRSASMLELKSLHVPNGHYDVAILGGGLAGLSMALQLKLTRPDTRVLVTDKRTEPAPEAAFKVGESSVEVGAHYYREVVGMRDHLEQAQLRKHGLRFLLPAGDNSDITKRVEFCTPGAPRGLHAPDRSRTLRERALPALPQAGAEAFRGWRVQDVEIGERRRTRSSSARKTTRRASRPAGSSTRAAAPTSCAASSTSATRPGHHINAAWIRLAGGLDFEDWTDDEEWLNRMPEPGLRRLSTTHLIDEGYWLWMIQLASGPISIGVCADPRVHPWEEIESFDAFMEWTKEHEPLVYNEIDGRREDVLDFLRVKDFSYASTRVFSPDRWTLVGEAGGFIDAFYSPGSDFIAYSNTFSNELICHDLDGGEADLEERVEFYNDFYFKLFNPTIHLYRDQYQFFGNAQVMVAKVVWDSLIYFTLLGSPFVHGKLAKIEDIEKFSEIADIDHPRDPPHAAAVPRLARARPDPVRGGLRALEAARALHLGAGGDRPRGQRRRAARASPQEGRDDQGARRVDLPQGGQEPARSSRRERRRSTRWRSACKPERWEEDGLFSDDGLTLAQAMEQLPGIEEMDLEARGAVVAG